MQRSHNEDDDPWLPNMFGPRDTQHPRKEAEWHAMVSRPGLPPRIGFPSFSCEKYLSC